MKMKLVTIIVALSLGGCATMSDYCEEHPRPCVLGGTAAAFVVAGVVAVEATKHNQVVVTKNPKP